MPPPMSEAEIAARLIESFEGSLVYAEVPVVIDGRTYPLDVATLRDGAVNAYECKVALMPSLVDQCLRWLDHAHEVYAVVGEPRNRSTRHGRIVLDLAKAGVGLIYVRETVPYVSVVGSPRRNASPSVMLAGALSSTQLVGHGPAAGSAGVRRHRADKWEPVRKSLSAFMSADVRPFDGLTIRELKLDVVSEYNRDDWLQFQRDARAGRIPLVEVVPFSSPARYRMKGADHVPTQKGATE